MASESMEEARKEKKARRKRPEEVVRCGKSNEKLLQLGVGGRGGREERHRGCRVTIQLLG
jgi:hypothetical protein